MKSIEDRHAAKVDVRGADECWPWVGAKRKGHGVLSRGARGDGLVQAHRVAYERDRGPIPDGSVIDHECHNRDVTCAGGPSCSHRACQNPRHLSAKTQGENVLASANTITGREARMTHCSAGHEFTEENTYSYRGGRYCRECRRLYWKTYKRPVRQLS